MRKSILAGLAGLAVVGCGNEPTTAVKGTSPADTSPAFVMAPTNEPYVFKLKRNNGAWYALSANGDLVDPIGFSNNGSCGGQWCIGLRINGSTEFFIPASEFAPDTTTANTYIGSPSFTWTIAGAAVVTSGLFNRYAVDANGNPLWDIRATSGQGVTTYQQSQLLSDAGNFRFESCANGTAANPAPTNVVLSVAGIYPKVVWTNVDPEASTEVWFGFSGQETYRQTVTPGVSSWFGQWQGGGIYQAKVRHVKPPCIKPSSFALSNTLTH